MGKQQKNEVKELRQLENDCQCFIDGLDKYLNTYRDDSEFVDSFCSARDKFNKAANTYPKNDSEKEQKKELLESALEDAKNCLSINDDFSQWINTDGLITSIEQEIRSI